MYFNHFFDKLLRKAVKFLRLIQYLLIIFSLIIQVQSPSFLTQGIYLLLSLIILQQIIWFFIERPKLKRVMSGILVPIMLLLLIVSQQFDPFLIILLLTNAYEYFKINYALIISIAVGLMTGGVIYLFSIPIQLTSILILIVVWAAIHRTQRVANQRDELQSELYTLAISEDQLTTQHDQLIHQSEILQEVRMLQERNRISRDIHDSAGHVLSTVVIQLEAIAKLTEEQMPQVSEMTLQLREFTKNGLQEVRDIIHAMKPEHYNRLAFIEKMQMLGNDYQDNTGIHFVLNYNDPSFDLTEDQQDALYRALQEFLGNTGKHAQADSVRMLMHYTESQLIVTMQDDGVGIEDIQPSVGLIGLKERVELLGGKVQYFSSVGKGFRTRIVLNRKG